MRMLKIPRISIAFLLLLMKIRQNYFIALYTSIREDVDRKKIFCMVTDMIKSGHLNPISAL